MKVMGNKEGEGSMAMVMVKKDGRQAMVTAKKRAVAMVTRMAGKDEGNGDGNSGKSNGNGNKEGNCKEEGNDKQQ